jgi:hypothetical protein
MTVKCRLKLTQRIDKWWQVCCHHISSVRSYDSVRSTPTIRIEDVSRYTICGYTKQLKEDDAVY